MWNPDSNHDGSINANDHFYAIQIYNAAAWGLNSDYTVVATKDDGTIVALQDATYSVDYDRLVYDRDIHTTESEISLSQLSKVVFTRKA